MEKRLVTCIVALCLISFSSSLSFGYDGDESDCIDITIKFDPDGSQWEDIYISAQSFPTVESTCSTGPGQICDQIATAVSKNTCPAAAAISGAFVGLGALFSYLGSDNQLVVKINTNGQEVDKTILQGGSTKAISTHSYNIVSGQEIDVRIEVHYCAGGWGDTNDGDHVINAITIAPQSSGSLFPDQTKKFMFFVNWNYDNLDSDKFNLIVPSSADTDFPMSVDVPSNKVEDGGKYTVYVR